MSAVFKVKNENQNPDYSRPPPGYLPTGERLDRTTVLQSNSVSSDPQFDHSSLDLQNMSSSNPDYVFNSSSNNYQKPLKTVSQSSVTIPFTLHILLILIIDRKIYFKIA